MNSVKESDFTRLILGMLQAFCLLPTLPAPFHFLCQQKLFSMKVSQTYWRTHLSPAAVWGDHTRLWTAASFQNPLFHQSFKISSSFLHHSYCFFNVYVQLCRLDTGFCRPAYIQLAAVCVVACPFTLPEPPTRSRNFVFLCVFCDSRPFCWSLPSIPSPPCLSQLLRKLKLQQHLQYKEQLYCFDPQVSGFCLHWGHQSQLSKQHQPPAFWRTAHKCVFLRFSLHGQRTNRHHTSALSNMLFRHQLQKIRVLK